MPEDVKAQEESDLLGRLSEATKMGQEPKDRLWAVIYAIAAVVLILGAMVIETRTFLSEGRRLGFERGSVDCLSVVVDNDRNFDLPDYCGRPEIVIFYPDEVCEGFFPNNSSCGVEKED